MIPLKKAVTHSLCVSLVLFINIFSIGQPPFKKPDIRTLTQLLAYIEGVMQQEQIPGLMISIVNKDSIIYSGGLGIADFQREKKVDNTTMFRMGSLTKNLTALAVLKLIQDGKVSLDSKVKDIAPELPFENSWETTHPLTVTHLLEHTSNFSDLVFTRNVNVRKEKLEGLDLINYFKDGLVCKYPPGSRQAYNNTNYIVLGYLIEKLSGVTWKDYTTENLLKPLQMKQANLDLFIGDSTNYARGYHTRPPEQKAIPFFVIRSNGASCALNACAEDMSKLIQFYLRDFKIDSLQWIRPEYLSEMEKVHTGPYAKAGVSIGYALGNHAELWYPKFPWYGHGGSVQGFASHMVYNRDAGVGFAIARNGGFDDARIAMAISDFLTQDTPMPEPSQGTPINMAAIQPYLGFYRADAHEKTGFLQDLFAGYTVSAIGEDRLLVKPFKGRPIVLLHVKDLIFRDEFETLPGYVFGSDEGGNQFLSSSAVRFGHITKTSFAGIAILRALFLLGVLAMLLSIPTGISAIILVLLKKISGAEFILRIIPMLASLSLYIGISKLLRYDDYFLSFSTLTGTSFQLFIGTLLFGVLSVLGVYSLIRSWRNQRSRIVKVVLAFNTIFIAYVACFFLVNGWIGVMSWNW